MATEATDGMIYNGRRFLSVQNVEIIDLISEGEIEGLASGNYLVEGKLGEVGWRSATFSGFKTLESGQEFLRSVYWNETPVIDDNGRSNFQKASVSYSPGDSDGGKDLNIGERDIINENFDPISKIAGTSDFKATSVTVDPPVLLNFNPATDPYNYGAYGAGSFNQDFLPLFDRGFKTYLSTTKIFRAGSTYHFDLGLTGGDAGLIALVAMGDKRPASRYEMGNKFYRYGHYGPFTTTGGAQNLVFSIIPSTDSPHLYIIFGVPSKEFCIERLRARERDLYKSNVGPALIDDCHKFTAPALNNCDVSLSRTITSKNGGSSIVLKNSLDNWVVTAYSSSSFDPAIWTFPFTTATNMQLWSAFAGASMQPNVSENPANILVNPTTSVQTNGFYGGAFYNAVGGWAFENECSVHISAASIDSRAAKVRFSFSENTDEGLEAFGFDMELTNAYVLHEYFCLGKRALLGTYRLNLYSINGVPFKVDFIQVNKAAIRLEIDAPRKLELFKKYNFSVNIKGTYNDLTVDRAKTLPVILGISNSSSSAELVSNQPFTSVVPYSSFL